MEIVALSATDEISWVYDISIQEPESDGKQNSVSDGWKAFQSGASRDEGADPPDEASPDTGAKQGDQRDPARSLQLLRYCGECEKAGKVLGNDAQ